MTNSNQFQVLEGPSRETLFDALRLRHEGKKVFFTLRPVATDGIPTWKVTHGFHINSISVFENDGDRWLIKLFDRKASLAAKYLCGYYNSSARTGWMRLDD